MLRQEVENRLKELKEYKLVKFTMEDGTVKIVHLNNLEIFPDIEFVRADITDNFASTYLDIVDISPVE